MRKYIILAIAIGIAIGFTDWAVHAEPTPRLVSAVTTSTDSDPVVPAEPNDEDTLFFFATTVNLVRGCQYQEDDADVEMKLAYCYGYLGAIADAIEVYANWGDMKQYACIPDDVDAVQLATVFMGFINSNPAYSAYGASSVATSAYAEFWPCKP